MAEVINLNRVRKQREKQQREVSAAANRAKFGRPGAEKRLERAKQDRSDRDLDGKRLEPDS
ncbi:Amidase [uncultured Gammaproteobacteria bacterium]